MDEIRQVTGDPLFWFLFTFGLLMLVVAHGQLVEVLGGIGAGLALGFALAASGMAWVTERLAAVLGRLLREWMDFSPSWLLTRLPRPRRTRHALQVGRSPQPRRPHQVARSHRPALAPTARVRSSCVWPIVGLLAAAPCFYPIVVITATIDGLRLDAYFDIPAHVETWLVEAIGMFSGYTLALVMLVIAAEFCTLSFRDHLPPLSPYHRCPGWLRIPLMIVIGLALLLALAGELAFYDLVQASIENRPTIVPFASELFISSFAITLHLSVALLWWVPFVTFLVLIEALLLSACVVCLAVWGLLVVVTRALIEPATLVMVGLLNAVSTTLAFVINAVAEARWAQALDLPAVPRPLSAKLVRVPIRIPRLGAGDAAGHPWGLELDDLPSSIVVLEEVSPAVLRVIRGAVAKARVG